MQQDEIKRLVKKYNLISTGCLAGFLLLAVAANWFLLDSNIEHRTELGLEYTSTNLGFTWGTIIIGLNIVLQLLFYSLEKILIKVSADGSGK
jgi:hypothetical protein